MEGALADAGASATAAVLTVVVTTSPSVSNPATALIQNTLASVHAHLGPAAAQVRKIVVCDGFNIAKSSTFRQAKVTDDDAARYATYLARLRVLCETATASTPFANASLILLKEHHGFPLALRQGISRVRTPLVMVLQHDRAFVNDVDIARVCREMRRCHDWLYYVGFPTKSTIRHDLVMLGQSGGALAPAPFRTQPAPEGAEHYAAAARGTYTDPNEKGLTLLPLYRFYDSTHVAQTAWYADFIFGVGAPWKFARRGFVEEKVTEVLTPAVLDGGVAAHRPYGMYLLWPDGSADRSIPKSYDARGADAPAAEPYGPMWPTVVGHVNAHRDGNSCLSRKFAFAHAFVPDADTDAWLSAHAATGPSSKVEVVDGT